MYDKAVRPVGVATNRIGAVHAATSDLDSAVSGAECVVNELIDRLIHVVNDSEQLKGGECGPAYAVPLAVTVQGAELRIRSLTARLRDTLDRLEI